MALLETKHPEMALKFKNGHFAVHKTERMFSAIAIDQAHEQNNKVVKGDGRAVGLIEDPSALRRWMVSGPEISRLIEQFEYDDPISVRADFRHHEETEAHQHSFLAVLGFLAYFLAINLTQKFDFRCYFVSLHVRSNP